jgi:leucyl/phenylalanyl-tRNA---protein transferase
MFLLNPHSKDFRFPSAELASRDGLLAVGGDLSVERLLEAYRHGIFPWYNEGQPILWWSPDPRAVLLPDQVKVSRSLRKTLRSGKFRVTFDHAFTEVMRACAAPRRKQPSGGTWITPDMLNAYAELHRRGYAHSVETWQADQLVGGLYGVALGGAFFGESMFSHVADASKVALVCAARQLAAWGCTLIDCQLPTDHLARLGATSVPRREYMVCLKAALDRSAPAAPWHFDTNLCIG